MTPKTILTIAGSASVAFQASILRASTSLLNHSLIALLCSGKTEAKGHPPPPNGHRKSN